jgi:hypothetical protein
LNSNSIFSIAQGVGTPPPAWSRVAGRADRARFCGLAAFVLFAGPVELALAAGVTELLAEKEHQAAPSWTREIGQLAEPFYVSKLAKMPRSAEEARRKGPEPLRRVAELLSIV